jgi:hypothetical protein
MRPQQLLKLIPQITDADRAFPAGPLIEGTYRVLTPIALEWEKSNGRHHWAMELFSTLFFSGGHEPRPNRELEDVTDDDLIKVMQWSRAARGSFYPKHEHKEAVCAMLWDTFFLEPDA